MKAGVTDCRDSLEIFYDKQKSIVLKGANQRESTEWITAICSVVDALIGDNDEDGNTKQILLFSLKYPSNYTFIIF